MRTRNLIRTILIRKYIGRSLANSNTAIHQAGAYTAFILEGAVEGLQLHKLYKHINYCKKRKVEKRALPPPHIARSFLIQKMR